MRDDQSLFQEGLELYRRHDADALALLYSPDVEVVMPFGTVSGRGAAADLWRSWFAAFPDVDSDIGQVEWGDGGFVVPWVETGTHLGPLEFGGTSFPPSGRRLEWSGRTVYATEGGSIRRAEYQVDPAPLMALLAPEISA